MLVPDYIVHLLKPWNHFYSHSKATETVVQSLHIGGVLMAGGLAIAADRGTFRALRTPAPDRAFPMRELAAVHRWVLTGLTIVVISGLGMLAADIETFFGSWIFWTKMGLFVVLLVNGLVIVRTEAELRADPGEQSPHWDRLRVRALTSIVLWFTLVVLGVSLVNLT
jgi:uncharacterized membrane protein